MFRIVVVADLDPLRIIHTVTWFIVIDHRHLFHTWATLIKGGSFMKQVPV